MTQPITRINPSTLLDAGSIGYSQISIVESSKMAYISGQVATGPNGEPTPEGMYEQSIMVARNSKLALEAIGATPNDIAIARIFVVGLNEETMNESFPAILAMFDGAKPSITGIGVSALASPELKIEMELTVRVPN